MGSIMLMHNDRDVLEICSKTLEFLCTEGSGIFTKCDIARSNIIDQCVNRYKEAIDDWRNLIAGEEVPNEDEIFNIIVSLKKVSILYSCHNLNPWGIFDSLYEDLDECQSRTAEGKALPNEVNFLNQLLFLSRNFTKILFLMYRRWFTVSNRAILLSLGA